MICGFGFSCAWAAFTPMLDTSERQIRTAIAMMIHKILFMDFPFGFVFLFHPTIVERNGQRERALFARLYRWRLPESRRWITSRPKSTPTLCVFREFSILGVVHDNAGLAHGNQTRAGGHPGPPLRHSNQYPENTRPAQSLPFNTGRPIRESEVLPLLRRWWRGRRRLHDRAFSGSARRWILFSNHGLLLIPWKLVVLKTLPSRLRRQAPTCRRHPLRECARHHQAILPPQSRNVLHPGDSATPWASRKGDVSSSHSLLCTHNSLPP